MKGLIFEVETTYKSDRKRTETIYALDETNMWAIYDKHHNRSLIESLVIVDAWIA